MLNEPLAGPGRQSAGMASATPARKRDKAFRGEAEAASSRKRAKLTRRTYGKFEVC